MRNPYLLKNIEEFDPGNSAAKVLPNAFLYDEANKKKPIFYKKKKTKDPQLSVNEVVFSELASLFMLPNSTPKYQLVVDENGEVTGAVSHPIQFSIAQQLNVHSTRFKNIRFAKEKNDYVFDEVLVSKASTIPYQFLNELPQDIFSYLNSEQEKGNISLDMESLANSLAGKYILEEDDLHRGNIGIYTIIKNRKPHVCFFNIDHDLMLSNSITSFFRSREANWLFDETAFNITPWDLSHFPDLRDSRNHYWPTRTQLIVRYGDNKIYALDQERNAFKNLKNNSEFIRYKWKRFLKAILIPNELIRQAIALHLNLNDAKDRARFDLIAQAMNERLIQLKANLFTIPEFRNYLHSIEAKEDIKAIKQELNNYVEYTLPKSGSLLARMHKEINESKVSYLNFANTVCHEDSPLHISIRLGAYRFEESHKAFSSYLRSKNEQGETPLDVAATIAETYQVGSEKTDPARDPFAIMQHLVQQGAPMTPKALSVLKNKQVDLEHYRFHAQYFDKSVHGYKDLKKLITELGQDSHFSLKTKKIITVELIKQHLQKLSREECQQFKEDLNGTKEKPIAPEFLFISQLRSSLWIIRIIRGLYGNSSTRMELNELIQTRQNNLTAIHNLSFFVMPQERPSEGQQELSYQMAVHL